MSRDLLQLIENLPKSLQQEVMEFIKSLIAKNKMTLKSKRNKSVKQFQWEDALKNKYKNISSVELQHKIWD